MDEKILTSVQKNFSVYFAWLPKVLLSTIGPDGFDRAGIHCFGAKFNLIGGTRLLVNVRIAVLIVPREIGWSGVAADIAIDACFVNVKFSRHIVRELVIYFRHRMFMRAVNL